MAECNLPKVDVGGSIPLSRSIKNNLSRKDYFEETFRIIFGRLVFLTHYVDFQKKEYYKKKRLTLYFSVD